VHQDYDDGKHDWRFDVPAEAADAYRELASDPYFNP